MNSSQKWIRDIKSCNEAALEHLYCSERASFLAWAKKHFQCPIGDAKELYQITILITYDNIAQGRLVELNCTFKSYLCAVAKNKWKEWQRAKMRVHHIGNNYFSTLLDNPSPSSFPEELINKMSRCLDRLGDPCKKLLEAYYYQKKSMTEIAEQMGYKNADTTKNLKYKCLQRLKNVMARNLNTTDHVSEFTPK